MSTADANRESPAFERVVLVTGGAGFIGSHVVIRFVQKYPTYKIVTLDKLDYCASTKNLDAVRDAPNFRFVKGSVLSSDLVACILETEKVDTIMHFAAQTHVDNSFGNSLTFTENNVMGTHVLLEAARQLMERHPGQLRRFVHVSTDEVYGEGNLADGQASQGELTRLDPTNPYAATKAGAELLAKAYSVSFGLPLIITRGNNVYGPHQYPEKIVPKFINLLMRGQALPIHGDGNNARNYLFVEDCARAFDTVLHRGEVGTVYNIGSNTEMTNTDVAKQLLKMFNLEGQEEKYLRFVQDRRFNDLRYPIDSTRLKALGWEEETSWADGLARTVAWYKAAPDTYWQSNVESALVAHPRQQL